MNAGKWFYSFLPAYRIVSKLKKMGKMTFFGCSLTPHF